MASQTMFVGTQYLLFTCMAFLPGGQGETTMYRGAVYEHVASTQRDSTQVVSRKQALAIIMNNLAVYEKQAVIASSKNVSMIVFPESGLYGVGHTRESIYPYLEEVTDPGLAKNIPCDDILFPPVQRYLSCIAKNNSIYVVANMGDVRICDNRTSPLCPSDGRFQFSANVVYDNQGKQVALYHKRHLFNESRFDPAPLAEHSTFETKFGKFATLIHEDIFFNDTAVYLWWNYKINSVVITSAARNEFPYTVPVVAHRGFSMLFLYNVLSAGLRDTKGLYTGSGIFSENCGVYYMNFNNTGGKLLIYDLPVKPNSTKPCGPYGLGLDTSSYEPYRPDSDSSDFESNDAASSEENLSVMDRSENVQNGLSVNYRSLKHPGKSALLNKYTDFQTDTEIDEKYVSKETRPNIISAAEDLSPLYVINFKSLIHNDSFTMAPLTVNNSVLQVCQTQAHCCLLYYNFRSNPDDELYALGAYMGPRHHGAAMFVRMCVLLKCKTRDVRSCGEPVHNASTTFDKIWLTSAADTIFMLPYVVTVSDDGTLGIGLQEFTYLPANFSSIHGFKDPLLSITLLETYYDPY